MTTEKEINDLKKTLKGIQDSKRLDTQKKELEQKIKEENEPQFKKVGKEIWKRFMK